MCIRAGPWRSLVAHLLGVQVVVGSNPTGPTRVHGIFYGLLIVPVMTRLEVDPLLAVPCEPAPPPAPVA